MNNFQQRGAPSSIAWFKSEMARCAAAKKRLAALHKAHHQRQHGGVRQEAARERLRRKIEKQLMDDAKADDIQSDRDRRRDECDASLRLQVNVCVGSEGAAAVAKHLKAEEIVKKNWVRIGSAVAREAGVRPFGADGCSERDAFEDFADRLRRVKVFVGSREQRLVSDATLEQMRVYYRFGERPNGPAGDVDDWRVQHIFDRAADDPVADAKRVGTFGCWLHTFDPATDLTDEQRAYPRRPSEAEPSYDEVQMARSQPEAVGDAADVLRRARLFKQYAHKVHLWGIANRARANPGALDTLTSPYCPSCGALKLPGEVPKTADKGATGHCCQGGAVTLAPLPLLPLELHRLYYASDAADAGITAQHNYFVENASRRSTTSTRSPRKRSATRCSPTARSRRTIRSPLAAPARPSM